MSFNFTYPLTTIAADPSARSLQNSFLGSICVPALWLRQSSDSPAALRATLHPQEVDTAIGALGTNSASILVDPFRFTIHGLTPSCVPLRNLRELTGVRSHRSSSETEKVKYRSLLGFIALMNGMNYVCTKLLEEAVPAAVLTFLRFAIASVCFLPDLVLAANPRFERDSRALSPGDRRRVAKEASLIGLSQAVGYMAQVVAIKHCSPSKVAFFTCLSVVLCPLLALLNPKERDADSKVDFIAPSLALLGVGFMEFADAGGMQPADLLLLLIPVSFAVGFSRSERLGHAFPGSVRFNTAVQMLTVSALSLVWAISSRQLPTSVEQLSALLVRLKNWRVALGLAHAGVITTAWSQLVEQQGERCLSLRQLMITGCSHSCPLCGGHSDGVHPRASLRCASGLAGAQGGHQSQRYDRRFVHHRGMLMELSGLHSKNPLPSTLPETAAYLCSSHPLFEK